MFTRKTFKNFDYIFLLTIILIFSIGLAVLHSATSYYAQKDNGILLKNFLIKQIIWFTFAALISVLIFSVDYQKWLELAYPLYAANVLLLVLVLVLGQTKLGAQRWIGFSNFGFQPSEFSKIIVILTLARYLGKRKSQASGNSLISYQIFQEKAIYVSCLLVIIPFALIVKQPDLGTALTLVPILFAVLYVWGVPLRTFLLVIFAGILSSPLLWHLLKDYQKRRILVFIDPNMDPLGAGYTIIQSKIAIGSGGFWGKGWLSGTQNQLNFLPERHTDFIFSVVGEEWGFLGAALVLILYMTLVWRAYSCAGHSTSMAGKLLICGIVMMFSFQVIVNIAMTLGLMPVVGLPLPLISYGGSSLLTTMVSLALILNVGMRRSVF